MDYKRKEIKYRYERRKYLRVKSVSFHNRRIKTDNDDDGKKYEVLLDFNFMH